MRAFPLPFRVPGARPAACAVVLGLLLVACGGGGALQPAAPSLLDLGTLASTVPARTEATFTNPLNALATVTAGSTDGPFRLDPADLPATVPAGASFSLGVLADTLGEGITEGSLSLVFTSATGSTSRTFLVRADGEEVTWGISTPTLDFGAVDVGLFKDLEARALNLSGLSPVTFTGVTLPSAAFHVVGDPFPTTVEPGGVVQLTLRYEPLAAPATDDGTFVLGPADPGAGLRITVRASALNAGSEEIVDFGSLSLDGNGRTALLSVAVPADAISLTVEGLMDGGITLASSIGLDTLTGPGDKVYENSASTGDYIWIPGIDVFSTTVPNTDRTNVQLVPGGGTYRFRLRKLQGIGSSMSVRAIIERRSAAAAGTATLDMNVWLAKGITPTAATAASDSRLQAVLDRIDAILSGQGISVGKIDYYDVSSADYDEVTTQTEFAQMLKTTSSATEARLNLFFVKVALGGGVVGVSATIAGPKRNGTTASGVMSVYEGYSTSMIGLIAAHEIGHFIGLYHTVEQDGSHDFVDDTLECPATGTDSVCTTAGGGYLMHWQAVGGTTLTDGQGAVIRGHPDLGPADGSSAKPRKPRALTDAEWAEALTLPPGWCGTGAARRRKGP